MNCLFFDLNSLTTLDVSNFNTENVIKMSGMFYNCNLLTSIDVSKFNTKYVNTME